METLRRRLTKDEDGFTLIELMVVVLIIAILIAIAIPTFLGAQDRARDRGAQSDLRNALTAAKTIATDDAGEFDTVTVSALQTAEGSLTFGATGTNVVIGVVPATPSADYILLYKQSASGKWFGVQTSKSGQVGYCSGAAAGDVSTGGVTAGALTGCAAAKW